MISAPDVHYMALAVYHESRGEPLECQRLVASVVKKRMVTAKKSAKEVVAQPGQFSWYGKRKKVKDSESFQQAIAVANHVMALDTIPPYQYFHKGKRGGYRCGGQVFSVAYNQRK